MPRLCKDFCLFLGPHPWCCWPRPALAPHTQFCENTVLARAVGWGEDQQGGNLLSYPVMVAAEILKSKNKEYIGMHEKKKTCHCRPVMPVWQC